MQRKDMEYLGRRILEMAPKDRNKKERPKRFMDAVKEDVCGVTE